MWVAPCAYAVMRWVLGSGPGVMRVRCPRMGREEPHHHDEEAGGTRRIRSAASWPRATSSLPQAPSGRGLRTWACRAVGQQRSTQRLDPPVIDAPMPSLTGAGSRCRRCSSTRARRGGTPGSSPSTAACASSCSTADSSTARSRPLLIIEDWGVDYNDNPPTPRMATSPHPSSPRPGPSTNQKPLSPWTAQRVAPISIRADDGLRHDQGLTTVGVAVTRRARSSGPDPGVDALRVTRIRDRRGSRAPCHRRSRRN